MSAFCRPIAPLPKVAVAANFGVCEPRVGWNNLRMNLRRCRDLLRPVLVAKSPVMPDFPTFRDVSRCFKVGHANVLTSLSCAKALILTFLGAAYHAYGYVRFEMRRSRPFCGLGMQVVITCRSLVHFAIVVTCYIQSLHVTMKFHLKFKGCLKRRYHEIS